VVEEADVPEIVQKVVVDLPETGQFCFLGSLVARRVPSGGTEKAAYFSYSRRVSASSPSQPHSFTSARDIAGRRPSDLAHCGFASLLLSCRHKDTLLGDDIPVMCLLV
jgi:hypothetical protein